ncbi:hypothetical protein B0T17DRAFT_532229 [Bombardia bombarda]|uniref:Uncharacterized protein n=1 Tax=Bombardia bombarda TaxID=252184 RepID=A0AA39X1G6_9PEZI|nr:hypothetical protein B0T17DRAFT_532229 [Bombardia bombarda]
MGLAQYLNTHTHTHTHLLIVQSSPVLSASFTRHRAPCSAALQRSRRNANEISPGVPLGLGVAGGWYPRPCCCCGNDKLRRVGISSHSSNIITTTTSYNRKNKDLVHDRKLRDLLPIHQPPQNHPLHHQNRHVHRGLAAPNIPPRHRHRDRHLPRHLGGPHDLLRRRLQHLHHVVRRHRARDVGPGAPAADGPRGGHQGGGAAVRRVQRWGAAGRAVRGAGAGDGVSGAVWVW